MTHRSKQIALLVAALAVAVGCATRDVSTVIIDKRGIEVELRGQVAGGEPVDRGFKHPSTLSVKRLVNILTAIEYKVPTPDDTEINLMKLFNEDSDSDTKFLSSIVTAETVLPIAKGMALALRRADSSQYVVVKAVRKKRRLGLFHRKFYTGFSAWVEGQYLYIHVSHLDFEIDNDPKTKIPDPTIGKAQSELRSVPNEQMHAVGPYGLAIRWRDPIFMKSRRALEGPDVRTRTILMESEIPEGEVGAVLPSQLSDRLTPDTLRALADLEDERRSGKLSEADYRMRRDALLHPDADN